MKLSITKQAECSPAASSATAPLYVLKFGSSVLRTAADLPIVAGEIYRQRRAGRRIVAVVSALAGDTDRLLAQAAGVTGPVDCAGIPDLVSLGEERTAALLRLACDRIGLPAEICRPEELRLRTTGDALSAHPSHLEAEALTAKLAATGLVIVPGFVGIGDAGERTLLGRGGSDFSAIFIGGELEAECVRLYKDVDGVFDSDPARHADARRFAEISWDDALRIARPLIQPQSVEYAAAKGLPIEVVAIGSDRPTRVAASTGATEEVEPSRPLRVSIAGFGTVGQALVQRLGNEPRFEIAAILARDPHRARAVPAPVPLTTDLHAFLDTPTDIIVDVLSCEETGALLCGAALPEGVHIVSASKRVISAGHAMLAAAAAKGGAKLLYSAAVGGAAPVLETVARARALGQVREVAGVLNGTVNFILDHLAQGLAFDAALDAARAAGFAEEDSTADLSGADAAAKIRLVAHQAFGIDPQALDVATEPLDAEAVARIVASGERWVQIASVDPDGARVSLQPARAIEGLPTTPSEWNAAVVTLEDGRRFHCLGRGAGGAATAEAIVADLFEIVPASAASSPQALALAC
ncbi:amino acid kinase family protein [Allosphingosinicella humi]